MKTAGLVQTGLFGTFLAQQDSEDIFIRPGGQGPQGDPQDNDDFRFDLTTPAVAVGIPVGDNRLPEGEESVWFLSAGGTLIVSTALPGGSSGSGVDGFVGTVLQPGDPFIERVEVFEGSALDGDITIDNIMLKAIPLPPAAWLLLSAIALLITRIRT